MTSVSVRVHVLLPVSGVRSVDVFVSCIGKNLKVHPVDTPEALGPDAAGCGRRPCGPLSALSHPTPTGSIGPVLQLGPWSVGTVVNHRAPRPSPEGLRAQRASLGQAAECLARTLSRPGLGSRVRGSWRAACSAFSCQGRSAILPRAWGAPVPFGGPEKPGNKTGSCRAGEATLGSPYAQGSARGRQASPHTCSPRDGGTIRVP